MPEASTADVDRAVVAAREAFDRGPWPRLAPEERQRVVARFNELHSGRADELAALVTSENGSAIWFTTRSQRNLKDTNSHFIDVERVSLELGGKSPSIVLPDADLNQVATALRGLSLGNNGEMCTAHTRILAPRSRYDEVVDGDRRDDARRDCG